MAFTVQQAASVLRVNWLDSPAAFIPDDAAQILGLYRYDVSGVSAAAGSAAGSGAVAGVGQFIGPASSAGTSAVSGAGIWACQGSAVGQAACNAVGQDIVPASSAGTSAVSAVGLEADKATSAGTSTASGVGQLIAVGAASGTSTALWTGAFGTVAQAVGTSTASAVGQFIGPASSAGTSTTSGAGLWTDVASASGLGSLSGIGQFIGPVSAIGVATASGVGLWAAAGSSTGTSTVSGVGQLIAVASASGASTASASGAFANSASSVSSSTASGVGQLISIASAAGVASVNAITGFNAISAGSSAVSAVGQFRGPASASGSSTANAVGSSILVLYGEFPPDTIAASTNLDGVVSYIQDDPDSPDANWLTATSVTAATDLRVTFPSLDGDPRGTQTFRFVVRKTTGTPTPTVSSELWQSGSIVKSLVSGASVTSTTSQLLSATWNSSDLVSILDGSDVELRLVSSPGLSSPTPGALPALNSGAGGQSATAPWTNQVLTMPVHAVGDLLIAVVGTRNTTNDGLLTSVNATGGTTGWTLANNSGSGWGGAQITHIAGFGWKIAASTSEVCSITVTGGGTDRYSAQVFRFTAADGFDAAAVANISSAVTGSSTSLGMPTLATGATNGLGVAIYAIASSSTVASATGETGGNWSESVAEYGIGTAPALTIGLQTVDLSGGGGISGGTAALGTTGVWVSLGFRLVPATIPAANVNTVEVGSVEWDVNYLAPQIGAASAIGSSTVSGVAAAIAIADAAAVSLASINAVGQFIGPVSSAGGAVALAVGKWAVVGSVLGSSSADAVGQLISLASSAGVATVAGIGVFGTVASVVGTSAVSGVGQFAGPFSAVGTSNVLATGAALVQVAASAVGTSTVLAQGQARVPGSSIGVGTATAVGQGIFPAIASGTSNVVAIPVVKGSASGLSVASGVPVVLALSSGISTVSATGLSFAEASWLVECLCGVDGIGLALAETVANAVALSECLAVALPPGSEAVSRSVSVVIGYSVPESYYRDVVDNILNTIFGTYEEEESLLGTQSDSSSSTTTGFGIEDKPAAQIISREWSQDNLDAPEKAGGLSDEWSTAIAEAINMFGEPAIYLYQSGANLSVTVLLRKRQEFIDGFGQTNLRSIGHVIEIKKSSLPSPMAGDSIVLPAYGTYKVRSVRQPDSLEMTWELDCIAA